MSSTQLGSGGGAGDDIGIGEDGDGDDYEGDVDDDADNSSSAWCQALPSSQGPCYVLCHLTVHWQHPKTSIIIFLMKNLSFRKLK